MPEKKVVLGNQALERFDITEGKAGITLTLILSIVDVANGFLPIVGAAVEISHCDAEGVYSAHASEISPRSAATTYLRGVQTTDGAGRVTFKTIYPGWCTPRATHVYIRIRDGGCPTRMLQLGFPDAINAAVYRDADRYIKGQNPTLNAADPIFGGPARNSKDPGVDFQIAPLAGDNASGYVAMVEIPIECYR